MSVPLYMDQHVPSAITQGLRQRGIDVLTTAEDQTSDWTDEPLLERARNLERVVFTQDDDFLVIAHEWQQSGREFCGIVYAHQLSITVGQAIRDLELLTRVMTFDELRNRIEFLPL